MRHQGWETTEGNHASEHFGRDAQCTVDDAAVEVHVGVQFAPLELVVAEGGFIEAFCDLAHGIVDAQFAEGLVTCQFDDTGTWVQVLVHTVTEAHEAEVILFDSLGIFAYRWSLAFMYKIQIVNPLGE